MKKILFVSHTANFSKFNLPYMNWFKDQGWEVHYACREEETPPKCDKHFMIPFERSPIKINNLKSCSQLKKIIDQEHYNIIHCHTPMGGVVTRIAARSARKKGTKILYTAHGFHFYKGAPIKNWLVYYTVEKILSKQTDCLITMNEEDYNTALEKHFKSNEIKKIDGVGVDLLRFNPVTIDEKNLLRKKYDIDTESFILIYVAEFTNNKNHRFIINCLPDIIKQIPKTQVIFAGIGSEFDNCKKLANELNVENRVHFLGYRKDVNTLLQLSDCVVCSSKREGLPMNIVEGMASGLPIVCTAIRGQTDLIEENINGFLFNLDDKRKFIDSIIELNNNPDLKYKMGQENVLKAQKYSLQTALTNMENIYRKYM